MSKQADIEFLFILALENYAKTSGIKIKSDKIMLPVTSEGFGTLEVAEHN